MTNEMGKKMTIEELKALDKRLSLLNWDNDWDYQAVANLISAEIERQSGCEYTLGDWEYGSWDTSCGEAYMYEYDPSTEGKDSHQFCQKCGRKAVFKTIQEVVNDDD